MTKQEAITIIETAIKEIEWEYPMDYAAAFDIAIECIQHCINEEKPSIFTYYCPFCGSKMDSVNK